MYLQPRIIIGDLKNEAQECRRSQGEKKRVIEAKQRMSKTFDVYVQLHLVSALWIAYYGGGWMLYQELGEFKALLCTLSLK